MHPVTEAAVKGHFRWDLLFILVSLYKIKDGGIIYCCSPQVFISSFAGMSLLKKIFASFPWFTSMAVLGRYLTISQKI